MPFRRTFVCLALALAATLSVSAQSPNIVLVSLDTFRADRLAAWGAPPELAPNLNALAAKGACFTGCSAPAPETLPSHATLLTGAYPSLTGLHANGFGRLAAIPTLAEVLSARGYATCAVVASPVLNSRYGLSKGFAAYDDALGSASSRTANDVTDRALAKLRAPRKGPVFLWVHYFDAHFPYASPSSYAKRTKNAPYDSAVAFVDAELGRLLRNLPPDTVVAVVSDHGEALGDHGEPTHGVFLFQPTIQVVCLLQGPGVPAGKASKAPASLGDVARTLASLAGVPASSLKGEGVDLLSRLKGDGGARVLPLEAWLPFAEFRWMPLVGVTDGRFKWVRGKSDHLYDLSADPGESKDLAAQPPAEAAALRARIPELPKTAPSEGQVDPALLGLGYSPAPGGHFDPAVLPDPYDRVSVLQDVAQGRLERASGQFDRAIARLRSATDRDPGNPYAWFEYGETLRRDGKTADAVKALDRAVSIAPQLYEAWTAKGHALAAEKKSDEAGRCYEKAVALQPDYTPAVDALAAYYLDLNQPDKAVGLIERAVSTGIADSGTYLLRGRVHLVQKKSDEAAKDFEAALRLSLKPEETLKQEADFYVILDQVDQGERLYQEGIKRYPGYAPNYLTLGSYFLQLDRPDKALPYFKGALGCDLEPTTRQQVQEMVKELEAAQGTPRQP